LEIELHVCDGVLHDLRWLKAVFACELLGHLDQNSTDCQSLANGKPLELIHVEFWSDNGPRSWGKTDDNGKFTLKLDTDSPRDGAVIGTHKVLLRDTWPTKDDVLGDGGDWIDNSKSKKARIHSKYYDISVSPISVEVTAGEKNNFDLKVDSASK